MLLVGGHLCLLTFLAAIIAVNYKFIWALGAFSAAADVSPHRGATTISTALALPFIPAVGVILGWASFAWARETSEDALLAVILSLVPLVLSVVIIL